ncbi:MAG: hypothetical protein JO027_09075 [Solirubrobacterales bacterium]|nr:hypothetical protein [Solirubrobacterales bacterium]
MQTSTESNNSGVLTVLAPVGNRFEPTSAILESTARMLGAVAVLGVGLIHVLDAAATYQSTRWIFWSYMALIAGSLIVALVLLHWSSPLAWAAAAALAAGPLIGYLWSRTLGLPGDHPDVGNWLCTLGMVSLFVESSVLGLSAVRVGLGRRSR